MSADLDPTFTLVPPDDALTVDEQLDAALSGLVPDATAIDEPVPFGRGWAFDFEKGQFVANGTSPARIDGLDQLRMWIEKTLRTARFAHVIYTDDFGMDEPWDGLGFVFTPGLAAKFQSRVTDALLAHDRVTAVNDFAFQDDPMSTALFVSFTVVTDVESEMLDFQIPFGRP